MESRKAAAGRERGLVISPVRPLDLGFGDTALLSQVMSFFFQQIGVLGADAVAADLWGRPPGRRRGAHFGGRRDADLDGVFPVEFFTVCVYFHVAVPHLRGQVHSLLAFGLPTREALAPGHHIDAAVATAALQFYAVRSASPYLLSFFSSSSSFGFGLLELICVPGGRMHFATRVMMHELLVLGVPAKSAESVGVRAVDVAIPVRSMIPLSR